MVNNSNHISDSVKSIVTECPEEEDNVLFCVYLPTPQWEKVYYELIKEKQPEAFL